MKDLFDRAMPSGGIAGPWVLPLDGVMELARRPRLEFEEMFVPMREEDLSMGGIRMGLSNDFTKAVILMEDERVIELRLEHAENIKEAVFRGLGVADFIDVFWKSEDGRRFGAEIRQLARNGRSS